MYFLQNSNNQPKPIYAQTEKMLVFGVLYTQQITENTNRKKKFPNIPTYTVLYNI
jgi:hypothetical protein